MGKQGTVDIVYERGPSNEPIRLAIAEDTPSGASTQLRASIWQSVLVAGLMRNDDLTGINVSFTIRGRIDGPSAGGVCCVAMLSAIDGRSVPNDFAFTGTILPDGTIGAVGGVVEKIHAVKRAGRQRVVLPQFLRIETDLNTRASVDVVRLCESLGIERVPVSTIDEAYGRIHRLDIAPAPVEDHVQFSVARSLEDLLLQETEDLLGEGDQLLGAIPKEERTEVESDPLFTYFSEARQQASVAKRAGYLFVARSNAAIWRDGLRTRAANDAFPLMVQAKSTNDMLRTVTQRVEGLRKTYVPVDQCIRSLASRMPPIVAQLAVDFPTVDGDTIEAAYLKEAFEACLIKLDQQNAMPPEEFEALQLQAISTTALYLFMVHAQTNANREYQDVARRRSSTLSYKEQSSLPAKQISRLFTTALAACRDSFLNRIEAQLATSDADSNRVLDTAVSADDLVRHFLAADARVNELIHVIGTPGRSERECSFGYIASALAAADAIAIGSALNARWGELTPRIDADGKVVGYERPEMLDLLLRNARHSAIRQIRHCEHARVPCPIAIESFQHAEYGRSQSGSDLVAGSLVEYWQAALRAQALRMIFSPAKGKSL